MPVWVWLVGVVTYLEPPIRAELHFLGHSLPVTKSDGLEVRVLDHAGQVSSGISQLCMEVLHLPLQSGGRGRGGGSEGWSEEGEEGRGNETLISPSPLTRMEWVCLQGSPLDRQGHTSLHHISPN